MGDQWATEVTEFNVGGHKRCLSACMDLYDGQIVAYRMARRPVFAMVSSMLATARSQTSCAADLIVHSDQSLALQDAALPTERCLRDAESSQA